MGYLNFLCRIVTLGLALSATATQALERHALLIGIADYRAIRDLEGPRYDLPAMKEALVRHWGFKPENVRVLAEEAVTAAAIRRELRALLERSRPGDHVFLYYSGHGTSSADNRRFAWDSQEIQCSGALIPYDYDDALGKEERQRRLIIGHRDIRPVLERLDSGGRSVFVVFDTCFAGNTVRGTAFLPTRYYSAEKDSLPPGGGRCGDDYPYQNVVYLSASSSQEQAVDVTENYLSTYPTLDGKPHGYMTNALLRVLTLRVEADRDNSGHLDYWELYAQVHNLVETQTPQLRPTLNGDRQGVLKHAIFEYRGGLVSAPSYRPPPWLSLYLQEVDEKLRERIRNQVPGVRLSAAPPADLLLKRRGRDYRLEKADGTVVGVYAPARTATLLHALQQQVWLNGFVRDDSRQAPLLLDLNLPDDDRGGVVCEGEQITLEVTSGQEAGLLILGLDPLGQVSVLYPASAEEVKARLQPSRPFLLSGIEVVGKPNQGGYGTEYVVAFVFPKHSVWPLEFQRSGFDARGDYRWLTWRDALLDAFRRDLEQHPGSYAVRALRLNSAPQGHPACR